MHEYIGDVCLTFILVVKILACYVALHKYKYIVDDDFNFTDLFFRPIVTFEYFLKRFHCLSIIMSSVFISLWDYIKDSVPAHIKAQPRKYHLNAVGCCLTLLNF